MLLPELLGFTGKMFEIAQTNTMLLLIVFFVFMLLAYKVFKMLLKAAIIGVISMFFPIFTYLVGFTDSVTISQILWFGIAGISLFFVYSVVSGGIKLISWIFKPFKALFKEKKK